MNALTYYEAPNGHDLAGLVDPVDLPNAFRVIARPSAKSIHSMAGDLMRTFGATRDLYSRAQGANTLLNMASAWSLASGVTDLYIGEAQDMHEDSILESLEFTQRSGARLHLIYSFGETFTHADTLLRLGGTNQPYETLPEPIRHPDRYPAPLRPTPPETLPLAAMPDEEWMTFRAAYLHTLDGQELAVADRIYNDAYQQTRATSPTDKEAVTGLIASLWDVYGVGRFERTIAVRAVQAGLFRDGSYLRVEHGSLERWVTQYLLNPLQPHHYMALRAFSDPWRAAATVLHAQHVESEEMLSLRALDVDHDGNIPSLGVALPPDAGTIVAAQRWRQLIVADADPPLFDKSVNALRQGIRKVVTELDLPLVTYWRKQSGDRWTQKHGIRIEAIA